MTAYPLLLAATLTRIVKGPGIEFGSDPASPQVLIPRELSKARGDEAPRKKTYHGRGYPAFASHGYTIHTSACARRGGSSYFSGERKTGQSAFWMLSISRSAIRFLLRSS